MAAFAITGNRSHCRIYRSSPAVLIVVLLPGRACWGAARLRAGCSSSWTSACCCSFWLTLILYGWWTVQETLANKGLPDWTFDLYMANPLAAATVAFPAGRLAGYATPGVISTRCSRCGCGEPGGVRSWCGWRSESSNRLQENFARRNQ